MTGRHATGPLLDALRDTPVVFLQGARQTGKSTLVRAVAGRQHPASYLTLDTAAVLAAAASDPDGFVAGLDRPVVIDEAQRAPGLALAIKAAVDADRRPGQFLLTGSAGVMSLPKLAESLAGRMELHTLWPFSQGERRSDAPEPRPPAGVEFERPSSTGCSTRGFRRSTRQLTRRTPWSSCCVREATRRSRRARAPPAGRRGSMPTSTPFCSATSASSRTSNAFPRFRGCSRCWRPGSVNWSISLIWREVSRSPRRP